MYYVIVWIWKAVGPMDRRSMVCRVGFYECHMVNCLFGDLETLLCRIGLSLGYIRSKTSTPVTTPIRI